MISDSSILDFRPELLGWLIALESLIVDCWIRSLDSRSVKDLSSPLFILKFWRRNEVTDIVLDRNSSDPCAWLTSITSYWMACHSYFLIFGTIFRWLRRRCFTVNDFRPCLLAYSSLYYLFSWLHIAELFQKSLRLRIRQNSLYLLVVTLLIDDRLIAVSYFFLNGFILSLRLFEDDVMYVKQRLYFCLIECFFTIPLFLFIIEPLIIRFKIDLYTFVPLMKILLKFLVDPLLKLFLFDLQPVQLYSVNNFYVGHRVFSCHVRIHIQL